MDHTKDVEILDLRGQVGRLRQELADAERRAERAEALNRRREVEAGETKTAER